MVFGYAFTDTQTVPKWTLKITVMWARKLLYKISKMF